MDSELIDYLRTKSILYVEDDSTVMNSVKGYLNIIFKEVHTAIDGLIAYDIFLEKRPDILLTDIDMPNLNGIDLTKKIRENDTTTPIIIMTAHKNPDYLLEAVELNLTKYILKPFDGDELLVAMKKIFNSSKDDSLLLIKDNCFYDKGNKSIEIDEKSEHLTEKESRLLELLLKAKGNLVSYEEIETTIWYDTYMTQETLRALVKNLRKKLPKESIETVTGHGFKIQKR